MQTSIPRCAVGLTLSAIIAVGATGCGDSTTGNLKTYAELEGQSLEEKSASLNLSDGKVDVGAKALVTNKSADTNAADVKPDQVESKTDVAQVDSASNNQPAGVGSGDPTEPVDPKAETVGEPSGTGVKVARIDSADPTNGTAQPAGDVTAAKNVKREIKLLVPDKRFRQVDPDDAFRVSYDDIDLLKILNMDPVPMDAAKHFPEWLSGLNGKRIRIRGFMIPTPIPDGIRRFQLARDTQLCCFGRDPLPYDIVPVYMRTGETTRYIQLRPFDVVGVFHIENTIDDYDGTLRYVYKIDDANVIER